MITYALDGKRISTDIFRLHLKCVPARVTGKDADEYTCTKFTVQLAGAPEVELPAMKNWTYLFAPATEKGPMFGIDHAQFEKLVDAKGQPVPVDKAYHVYNAFIDFHAFCNVFAEPATGGKGIQDLKTIGQKIVHAAAFTEPPVNLGSSVKEGSTFKNGEVTLEFKGLSLVDDSRLRHRGLRLGRKLVPDDCHSHAEHGGAYRRQLALQGRYSRRSGDPVGSQGDDE